MQEPDAEGLEFEWDEQNEVHCAQHGVTPLIVQEIRDAAPKFFPNAEGKTGTHQMIGPDDNGRHWSVIILHTGFAGRWRAITGWPSTRREIKRYNMG